MVSYIKGSKKMSGQLIAQNFDISTHPIVFIITEFKFEINDHMFSEHFLGPWFHLFWLAVWAVECRVSRFILTMSSENQFLSFSLNFGPKSPSCSTLSSHHNLYRLGFLIYRQRNFEFVHLGHHIFTFFHWNKLLH